MIYKDTPLGSMLTKRDGSLVQYISIGIGPDVLMVKTPDQDSAHFRRDELDFLFAFKVGEFYTPIKDLWGHDGPLYFIKDKWYRCADVARMNCRFEKDEQYMSFWVNKWVFDFRPVTSKADLSAFPHSCPRCGAPAYIGFSDIDCSAKC